MEGPFILEELDLEPVQLSREPSSDQCKQVPEAYLEDASTNPSSEMQPTCTEDPGTTYQSLKLFLTKSKSQVGRKPADSTGILALITAQSGKPPKKENIRIQLIRKLSKIIRNMLKGKFPFQDFPDPQQFPVLWDIYNQIKANPELFRTLSDTHNGPLPADSPNRPVSVPKSFNNSYCGAFFHSSEMQYCYQRYLDLVFWEIDAKAICARLKHKCCMRKEHGERCQRVWRVVKRYLEVDMLRELHVKVEEVREFEEGVEEDMIDWESLLEGSQYDS